MHYGCGVLTKLIFNLILVPIPEIGVNGAAWGSVACHLVAFTIAMTALRKNIKLNLSFSKFVIKPVLATIIMGICSYAVYLILSGILAQRMVTIISILTAVIIYAIAIIALKVFSKEEIIVLPGGEKLCKILEKLKVY